MEENTTALPISEDFSQKIIFLAADEAHTIALTGDGCVYTWRRGMFDRLGIGRESDELIPVRIEFEFPNRSNGDRARIVGVAAGAYHSLAVSDDGSVWCWGYNIYGQLVFDEIDFLHRFVNATLAPRKPKTLGDGGPTRLTLNLNLKPNKPFLQTPLPETVRVTKI